MGLRGLYAIADADTLAGRNLLAAVAAAIDGGAALVQYRDKQSGPAQRAERARTLVELGRGRGVPVIINDDIELARATGAAGVHLGDGDGDPAQARARLGGDAIIGVSCYDELERARRGAAAGADYVAFGRMFPSPTKPEGPRPPHNILRRAREVTGLPVCAIGGITVDNAPKLIAAGADLLAVITDLFAADDIAARAAQYRALFAQKD